MDKNKKKLAKAKVKSAGDTVVSIDGEKFSVYGNFITCLLYTSPSPRD